MRVKVVLSYYRIIVKTGMWSGRFQLPLIIKKYIRRNLYTHTYAKSYLLHRCNGIGYRPLSDISGCPPSLFHLVIVILRRNCIFYCTPIIYSRLNYKSISYNDQFKYTRILNEYFVNFRRRKNVYFSIFICACFSVFVELFFYFIFDYST